MRKIEQTGSFKRDLKREKKSRHKATLARDFLTVVQTLAADIQLPPKFKDHPLSGNLRDHRDCHIKPDLVLIYRLIGDHTLQLVRLGSHSELGI